jgi:mannose-1-phosphate guanylyltransferase
LLLVLAADHVIKDQDAFNTAVMRALPLAETGKLVTFGIVPSDPQTGYGYIKRGNDLGEGFKVDEFVEKPSLEVAKGYISSGEYYWNSGMFLFRASRYLEELEKFRPDILEKCKLSVNEIKADLDFLRVHKETFESCPAESVDYAVMEKTSDAVVVPMDAGWSDIESWSSLWDISQKDEDGNSAHGDVILHNTYNSYVKTDRKLVAVIGVNDLVIVSTKDALMVAHKDSVQDVKIITELLKTRMRSEWELSREVYRPWGKYDSIDSADGYQVKRLTVNPGAKLSVQMHHHRSEHWVVVSGQARVHYGAESHDLKVNESTYHGKNVVHALENPGDSPLELIEVQVGDYLGEDDIVRFSDNYGRA